MYNRSISLKELTIHSKLIFGTCSATEFGTYSATELYLGHTVPPNLGHTVPPNYCLLHDNLKTIDILKILKGVYEDYTWGYHRNPLD